MQSLYQLTEGQIRINFISRVKFHLQYQPYLLWDNTFPYQTQNTIIQKFSGFVMGLFNDRHLEYLSKNLSGHKR